MTDFINKQNFYLLVAFIYLFFLSSVTKASDKSAYANPSHLPQQSLTDSEIEGIAGSWDQFGVSMAVDNGIAVIGALKAKGFGVAYIYEYDGNNWQFKQTIESSTPSYGDFFGSSVDIKGDTIVVGAYHDSIENIYGSVYIFEYIDGQWQQTQKIDSDEPDYESHFGVSVQLYGDWLFIGSSYDSVEGIGEIGRVHVYKRTGGDYVLMQKLQQPVPDVSSAFGVKIHITNGHLFVAATTIDYGKVYVFSLENNQWLYKQTLEPQSPIRGYLFGVSISQDNDLLAIGSPQGIGGVYLFELVNDSWVYQQEIIASDRAQDDWFGSSVKLFGDTLLVGSYRDDDMGFDSGSVYVFNKTEDNWVENNKLYPLPGTGSGRFGTQIELYNNSLLVSGYRQSDVAYRSGAVTAFTYDNTSWNSARHLDLEPGSSFRELGHAIHALNNKLSAVAIPNDNEPYATIHNYSHNHSGWVQTSKIQTLSQAIPSHADCHYAVAQNSDYLVFGSCYDKVGNQYGAGTVTIYKNIGGEWQLNDQIMSPLAEDSKFGKSLDINDNTLIVASAQGVFLYTDNNGWTYSDTLWSNESTLNEFGRQIKIEDNHIFVLGRKFEDSQLSDNYFFEYEFIDNQWQEVAAINGDAITHPDERFAQSFFWHEDKLVLNSPEKYGNGPFYGAVHYYEKVNEQWQHKQTIFPDNLNTSTQFASSAVFNSEYLFVGVPWGLQSGKPFGHVNVYRLNDGLWNQTTKLYRTNNNYYQDFGRHLALQDQNLFISTPRAREQGNDAGSVEVIDITEIDVIFKDGFN
mgnify:CR=1 FL=1